MRGHRVEPGEVEAVLRTHPDVDRAAVVAAHDGGRGRLLAFVQSRDPDAVTGAALRAHVAAVLPAYMVPARIRILPALPLTPTGKIDRRRLAEAADRSDRRTRRRAAASAPDAHRTDARAAWSGLLGVDAIGRDDDFFALGGDSILVLELFARLGDDLPALPRPTVIYGNRTLAALAAAIDAGDPAERTATSRPDTTRRRIPVTPTQRGFLLAEAVDPGADHAWLARPRLRGPLDRDRFQRAVDALVDRHPMLRTVFPSGVRPPVQQELPPGLRLPVGYETVPRRPPSPGSPPPSARRRFEPWAWPLIRLRLLRIAADEHVLLVHAHHLIGDGYSAALFGRELLARLRPGAGAARRCASTFRDYVALLGSAPAGTADAGARTIRPGSRTTGGATVHSGESHCGR